MMVHVAPKRSLVILTFIVEFTLVSILIKLQYLATLTLAGLYFLIVFNSLIMVPPVSMISCDTKR